MRLNSINLSLSKDRTMSTHKNLMSIYVTELQDLCSANDQMRKAVKEMAEFAENKELAEQLRLSATGINDHTRTLQSLVPNGKDQNRKEHCKAMEGLVKEARDHALHGKFDHDALRDVMIIAQYQRMAHYGIAGFGTLAALASALHRNDDAAHLSAALEEIYSSDLYFTKLAEHSINLETA